MKRLRIKKLFPSYIIDTYLLIVAGVFIWAAVENALHLVGFPSNDMHNMELIAYAACSLLTVRIICRATKNIENIRKKYAVVTLTLALLTIAVFLFNNFLHYLDMVVLFGDKHHYSFADFLWSDIFVYSSSLTRWRYALYFVLGLAVYMFFERRVLDIPVIKNLIFEPEPAKESVEEIDPELRKSLMPLFEDTDRTALYRHNDGEKTVYVFSRRERKPSASSGEKSDGEEK